MKDKIYLSTLLIISLFYSCDSNDLDYKSEYEISKKAWVNFKKSSNNSYKYTVRNSSWVGVSWETTITLENGIIIQRSFKFSSTEGLSNNIPKNELEWTENENEIGIHQNGAEPLTLDEVYNKAQEEWLIKRKNTTTFFETDNNGMISTCGYIENNCADDCFIGIKIKSIQVF